MTCAKAFVKATIVCDDGQNFVGTNDVRNPQRVCPRGADSERDSYELCKILCRQPGHAETEALRLAGPWAVGATIFVEHWRVCDACAKALERAGVAKVVLGPPPGQKRGW